MDINDLPLQAIMISRSASVSSSDTNSSRANRKFDYPAQTRVDSLCNVSNNSIYSHSVNDENTFYGHNFPQLPDKTKRERLGSFTSITSTASTINYHDSCSTGDRRPESLPQGYNTDVSSMTSSVGQSDMTSLLDKGKQRTRDMDTQSKLKEVPKVYTEKEKEKYRKMLKTTNWRKLRYRRPVWRWDDIDLGSMVYFKYAWVWQAGLLTGKYEETNEIEVIHYAKGWWFFEAGCVKEEKFTVNLDNNELMQINIPPALQRRPEEAVVRARELLGEQRYSMFTRRSSHMVLECLLKKDL